MLFDSKDFAEIFIKLGEKCPTSCKSCFYGTLGSKNYNKEYILSNIGKILEITNNKFNFFLYGIDTISNIDLLSSCLDIIFSNNRKAIIQVGTNMLLKKEYINKMYSLNFKYEGISFLSSININSISELDKYIKIIKVFEKLNFDNIRFDFIIDYKYLSLFEKKLNIKLKYNNIFNFYEYNKGTVINIVKINNNKVIGCEFNKCIFPKFYNIVKSNIIINELIELDINGNFLIHHPICFLSNIKISNINFTKQKIFDDFKKALIFFNKKENNNMSDTCFNCIKKGYTYEH